MRNALRRAPCHMRLSDGMHLLADLGGGVVQGIAQRGAGLRCRCSCIGMHESALGECLAKPRIGTYHSEEYSSRYDLSSHGRLLGYHCKG